MIRVFPPILPNPRDICLCFDGTGNKFGENNSNVVRLFRSIKKDDNSRQLAYYRAGIGTYENSSWLTRTGAALSSNLGMAFGWEPEDHVKDGYRYLMQNYRIRDRIHLFGLSEGAHIARSLAGMLSKVGLLPPHNEQQLDFAFSMYQSKDKKSAHLSNDFKNTFAIPVEIEFLGVWDTVSSVGLVPRSLPYSTVCHGVKVFRHALALDELHTWLRPDVWGEHGVERGEFEFDETHNEWVHRPPRRDKPDVKEVWFSGCHVDVGGGSHTTRPTQSSSNAAFRWMITEATHFTEIHFDAEYLADVGVDIINTWSYLVPGGDSLKLSLEARQLLDESLKLFMDRNLTPPSNAQQDKKLLQGRIIPVGANGKALFHSTVLHRMLDENSVYLPSASNWKKLAMERLIEFEIDRHFAEESFMAFFTSWIHRSNTIALNQLHDNPISPEPHLESTSNPVARPSDITNPVSRIPVDSPIAASHENPVGGTGRGLSDSAQNREPQGGQIGAVLGIFRGWFGT